MMTWKFQSTISDEIHRVVSSDGETVWGIDHRGFDADSSRALGTAEVELPSGRRTLLLVPALPGGLVLDAVRAYQGLNDGELCTLFVGIVAELRDCPAPEDRLTLRAFGLDARGRPTLIPGVGAALAATPRRAVGEMLYHAGHGRPWSECLLPVNLALAEASSALRSIVGEFLADSVPDPGLRQALAEVADSMRRLAPPAALPLVPADRDVDPEAALTARLRATAGHPPSRGSGESAVAGAAADGRMLLSAPAGAAVVGSLAGGERAPESSRAKPSSATETLRAASRRRRRRTVPSRVLRPPVIGSAMRTGAGLLAGLRTRTALITAGVCVTLIGGGLVWGMWPDAEATGEGAADHQAAEHEARQQHESRQQGGDGGGPDDTSESEGTGRAGDVLADESEVARVLEDLCSARARALSDGDEAGLQALTVPGSAAAAADELIDPSAFTGVDYTITVDDIGVVDTSTDRIVASARMHSSASDEGAAEQFEALTVEFELKRHEGRWKVEQVTETGP